MANNEDVKMDEQFRKTGREKFVRLIKTSPRGPVVPAAPKSMLDVPCTDEKINSVETTHTTVTPTYWHDDILKAIPKYVTPPVATSPQWTELFGSIHAYFSGFTPGPNLQYAIAALIMHCPNVWFETKARVGHQWEALAGATVTLTWDDTMSVKVSDFLKKLDSTDKVLHSGNFGTDKGSKLTLNDREFIDWYMDERNLEHAKVFFMASCISFIRIFVRNPENVYRHTQFRMWMNYSRFFDAIRPTKLGLYSKDHFKILAQYFDQKYSFTRGLMKCVLHTFLSLNLQVHSIKLRAFSDYTLSSSYKYYDFDVLKLGDKVKSDYHLDMRGFENLVLESKMAAVIKQFNNYKRTKNMILNYKNNPKLEMDGRTCRFYYWPYCRFFEATCFLHVSVSRNPDLIGFFIGLLPPSDEGAMNMQGLSRYWEVANYAKNRGKALRAHYKRIHSTS